MKILLIVTTLAASATAFLLAADVVHAAAKPNILYILADDLGYNDVGFNGCKEIKTPNLDKLAHDGTILKSFYGQTKQTTRKSGPANSIGHKTLGKTFIKKIYEAKT